MSPTALFGIIHESHCTILTNSYLYLQYFQQKIFSFSKISGFQMDTKLSYEMKTLSQCSVHLALAKKASFFYYSAYFYYYSWVSLYYFSYLLALSTVLSVSTK